MRIWIVSTECAGLSEAGGVKDVTYSLCDNFKAAGNDVTLFIPFFGCTDIKSVKNLKRNVKEAIVSICGQNVKVSYSKANLVSNGTKIVFIEHLAYSEKKGVYVYTEEEEKDNPRHIRGMGHTDVHFMDSLLSKAVAAWGSLIKKSEEPDIVHCQDASTSMTPAFIELAKPFHFENTKCVVTIHNAGPAYHHEFIDMNEALWYTELPWNWLSNAQNESRIEPFLIASQFAKLTTVSTFYANEITSSEFSSATDGLSTLFQNKDIKIEGITNGIDYYQYAPEHPEISLLPYPMNPFEGNFEGKLKNRKFFLSLCRKNSEMNEKTSLYTKNFFRFGWLSEAEDEEVFEWEESGENCKNTLDKINGKCVYFVYHGRLVWQKGIMLIAEAMEKLLPKYNNLRFIIVGQGETSLEKKIEELATLFEGKAVFFKGYNQHLSRLSVAQADFSLFPSNFEPCCLEDFISQLYGTIPLAHATGGLKKIIDGETGFLFSPNTSEKLCQVIKKAADLKTKDFSTLKMMTIWASNYVKMVYSWKYVTEKYTRLFKELISRKK